MANTRTINSENFKKICLSEEHDVLLLVYSSKIGSEERNRSSLMVFNYDSVALRFRDIKLNSVIVGAFDIYNSRMVEELDGPVPAIYLFPGKGKPKK